ncbi:MAG: glycosyltransferase family 4 protein [Thermodesulfobacteriota bacterium]
MKLLCFLRDPFPTFRPDVTALLGKYLPRQDISCNVVALPAAGNTTRPVAWEGGEVLLGPGYRTRPARQVGALVHDLRCLLGQAGRHDAILVRNKIVTAALALPVARWLGIPVYYHMTFTFPEDDLHRARTQGLSLGAVRLAFTWLRGMATGLLLYRYVLPRLDKAILTSDALRDALVARGIPGDRLMVLPIGVDMERTDLLRADSGPGPDQAMAYLGTLDRTRRVDFLFEVLARVRERCPDARLRLIGDASTPAEREWLETRARELGVERAVEITGWLPQDQAWRLAARSRVGVCALPLTHATQTMTPTKAVEFMALGLPLVVNEHPDQARLVNESGCGRCVPYDAGSFAAAVADLLQDPEAAREMGARGLEHVRAQRAYAVLSLRMAQLLANPAPRTAGV